MTDRHYTLTLNEHQAYVIKEALDLFSRIHMGQLDTVADVFVAYAQERGFDTLSFLRDELDNLSPIWTGLHKHAYHGIHSPKISDKARVAWDLQQVIRHRLAWDREPKGGIYVDFDTPMRSSAEPLASIQERKEQP